MTAIRCRAYFGTKEVAEYYGVSQNTVSRWCREGKFEGAKLFPWPTGYQRMLEDRPDVRRMWAVPQSEVLH